MADLSTARPYAKAVFELSQKDDCHDTWLVALQSMSECVLNQDFKSLLDHPSVSQAQLVDVILEAFKQQPFTQQQKNLLFLLAENGRLILLPDILDLYDQLWMLAKQTVVAQVISAEKIAQDSLDLIKSRLEERMKKNIQIQAEVDQSLIAGARIKIGDWVIDGTLSAALESLRRALTH